MFDVGFWELCLVGLVSLLVIGPEKLPKVARLAGFWIGKTQQLVSSVKAELKDELQEEELRQLIREQQDKINTMTDDLDFKQPAQSFLDSETDKHNANGK